MGQLSALRVGVVVRKAKKVAQVAEQTFLATQENWQSFVNNVRVESQRHPYLCHAPPAATSPVLPALPIDCAAWSEIRNTQRMTHFQIVFVCFCCFFHVPTSLSMYLCVFVCV